MKPLFIPVSSNFGNNKKQDIPQQTHSQCKIEVLITDKYQLLRSNPDKKLIPLTPFLDDQLDMEPMLAEIDKALYG